MNRYLIFDASCSACSSLARTIEAAAKGKLKIINIESEQAKKLLSQSFLGGWNHQPYLVTVNRERVSASTGNKMILQIGMLLGPQKAWRIFNLAQQYRTQLATRKQGFSSRRKFLKYTTLFAGFAGSLLLTSLSSLNAKTLLEEDNTRDGSLLGQNARPTWSGLPPDNAKAFAAVVISSDVFRNLRRSLRPGFAPDTREAYIIRREDNVFVAVPIKYRGTPTNSVFVGIVNNARALIGSVAWIVEETSAGQEVSFWQNGELRFTATFNSQGEVVSGLPVQNYVAEGRAVQKNFLEELSSSPSKQASLVIVAQALSCLNNCLSAVGVPLYVVGLVDAACSLACAVTVTLGCFYCAAAIFGAYAGVGVACLQSCGFRIA